MLTLEWWRAHKAGPWASGLEGGLFVGSHMAMDGGNLLFPSYKDVCFFPTPHLEGMTFSPSLPAAAGIFTHDFSLKL